MDPVPDPLLLTKSGSAGNRTRYLCICSQKLWPLDHRGGQWTDMHNIKLCHVNRYCNRYKILCWYRIVLLVLEKYDSAIVYIKFALRKFSLPLPLINTLRTGDADLRFYITTMQDGWRKSAFLKRACFPCTIKSIMQYIEPVSERYCWRMFIETWPHSELNFRHRASSI